MNEWWLPVIIFGGIALIGVVAFIGQMTWYMIGPRNLLLLATAIFIAKILHASWFDSVCVSVVGVVVGGWLFQDWYRAMLRREIELRDRIEKLEGRVFGVELRNEGLVARLDKLEGSEPDAALQISGHP